MTMFMAGCPWWRAGRVGARILGACSHSRDNPFMSSSSERIAVIDFETTGMGPQQGARATEIAVVLVEGGRIVDRYQSLMRTGVWVPPFISQLTGITNKMLDGAPGATQVMHEVAAFTRGLPLVAHNAAFDRSFWQAEMTRAGLAPDPAHDFACTVLLSRRVFHQAPSHKLQSLVDWLGLSRDGRAHRALSDADVTAQLLLALMSTLRETHAPLLQGWPVDHALLAQLQRLPKERLARGVAQHVAGRRQV